MNGSLYRYKPFSDWDKDRFLSEIDDIKNNRITLVSPELFNDPYDCLIPFFENVSEEEFDRILKPHIRESITAFLNQQSKQGFGGENFTISRKVLDRFEEILDESVSLDDFRKKFNEWSPKRRGATFDILNWKPGRNNWIENQNPMPSYDKDEHCTEFLIWSELELMSVISQTIASVNFPERIKAAQQWAKIACFSREYNSMYFWSHYANSHKGICMEYSFKFTSDLFAKPEEVQYYPSDSNGIFLKKFYSKRRWNDNFLVMTKSKDWEQEKEVRIAVTNVMKQIKATSQQEEFLEFKQTLTNPKKLLQKLDGSTDDLSGRRNLEKCECGEFRYRHYTTNKACAQIYCENCDDKKGSKSILKHEYSYQPITKIYLGLRFDENTESAKQLIETARSQNIPVYKMKLSKKKFSLEEELY